MMRTGNAVVAQSGGPTAVINNSVCGIVQGWQKHGFAGKLYGALFGITGVLTEKFIDLTAQDPKAVENLRHTPGAALGSCRYKVKTEEDYQQILDAFKKHDIRYFFYVGGNDSMDTADKVHQLAVKQNYEMCVIGVPKTVDNDLPFTDHCPGYGSAAKYLATTVMNTGLDLKSLITKNRVLILEAMGRNTGWLAAATALAKRQGNDPPHLIYLPETPFHRESFLKDVERVYKELNHVYVVVSEGIVDEKGQYVFAEASKDSFGHAQLGGLADSLKSMVEGELALKTRCVIPSTIQRSSMYLASKVDAEEAYLVGLEAVNLVAREKSGLMVTLDRVEEDYLCRAGSVELNRVSNVEKKLPREWITESGTFVTNEFLRYARPLIRGEVVIPMVDGLPDYCCFV
jgi:ATP-dependent phosphofructokinase / diphosphate-dependent phosphofructokinase